MKETKVVMNNPPNGNGSCKPGKDEASLVPRLNRSRNEVVYDSSQRLRLVALHGAMDHTCTLAASIVCFILLYLSYRTSGHRVPEIVDKRGDPRRSLSILVLIDVPAAGHLAAPVALSAKLARRGHNVTLCSTSVEGRADVADDVAENMAKKAGVTADTVPPKMRSATDRLR